MNTQFTDLLASFGKTVGIDNLTHDEGYCCLFFDEVVVNLEERDGILFLYTTVGQLPENGREKLYAALLNANCFYKGTQGATLGADEKAGIVMLSYQTVLSVLDDATFEKIVENFVNVADTWTTKVGELSRESVPTTAAAGQGMMV